MADKITKDDLVNLIREYLRQEKIDKEHALMFIDQIELEAMEEYITEGLYVIKRGNRIQTFSKDKLYNSIANASDEIDQPMNDAELDHIVDKIDREARATGNNLIHTYTVKDQVIDTLERNGYNDVADAYKNY